MPSKPESGFGPEVGFEEITTHLLQARFWIVSVLPTIRKLSRGDSDENARRRGTEDCLTKTGRLSISNGTRTLLRQGEGHRRCRSKARLGQVRRRTD